MGAISVDASSAKAGRAAELARELLTARLSAEHGDSTLLGETLGRVGQELIADPELFGPLLAGQATLTMVAVAGCIVRDLGRDIEELDQEELDQAYSEAVRKLIALTVREDLRY